MNDGLSAVLDMAWRDIEAAQQKQFAAISEAAWAPLRALADMPSRPVRGPGRSAQACVAPEARAAMYQG